MRQLGWMLLLLVGFAPATAQSVRGRVIDNETGQPVAGVRVELLEADGRRVQEVISGPQGSFVLVARDAGAHRLRVSHIAYRGTETNTFEIRTLEQVQVDVKVASTAVPLEPLTVTARRNDPRYEATEDGMYARRLLSKPIGNARVILPHDPEMVNAFDVRDVMQWMSRPRGCTAVWWNGKLVTSDIQASELMQTPVSMLEAVEYYKTPIEAPAVFRELPVYLAFSNAFCSVIALWPRTGRYALEDVPAYPNPYPWHGNIAATFYQVSGLHAPGVGLGLELTSDWSLRRSFGIALHFRASMHRFSAEMADSVTASLSEITYVLPPGETPLQIWMLAAEPRLTVLERDRLRVTTGARLQVAQRRFSIDRRVEGNPGYGLTSLGMGLGLAAGAELQVSERWDARASLIADQMWFGDYRDIERSETGARWSGLALQLGVAYNSGW